MRCWLVALVLALSGQDPPLPVPDPAAQKSAEKLVREVFKEQYSKTGAADRRALSRTLLEQAKASDNDSATRYVLLREAQALGDLEVSFQAADVLARYFSVDALALKLAALSGSEPKSLEESKAAALLALTLVDESMRAGDPDAADKTAQLAFQHARKAKDLPTVNRAQSKIKEVADARSRLDGVKKARQARTVNPDDPAACTTVGQFECIYRGNWEAGLPLLAKGDQAALKAAAAKDLAAPPEPSGQVEAGDAWWELSEKETGMPRESLRSRALFWYGRALPRVTGLTKVKLEARFKELGQQPPGESGGKGPFDLDTRGFIRNWLIVGPFPNAGDRGFDTDFLGGEAAAMPGEGATVQAPGVAPLKWAAYATDTERVEFVRVPHLGIKPEQPDLVVYSSCWVVADAECEVQLKIGSDDGNALWFDHRELARTHIHRGAAMDQESYPLKLTKGKHLLLVKVDQGTGAYQFMVRLVTPSGDPAPGLHIWN